MNPVLLGGTVLAWGNCVGDLVADTSMARDGYPAMAVAACFASPLFSLAVGKSASPNIRTNSIYVLLYRVVWWWWYAALFCTSLCCFFNANSSINN